MAELAALIVALGPIGEGLIAGKSIEAVLAGLTLPEWISLATAIMKIMSPSVEAEFQAFAAKVDPHLTEMIETGNKEGAEAAAKALFLKFSQRNADEAMQLQPGMGSDY